MKKQTKKKIMAKRRNQRNSKKQSNKKTRKQVTYSRDGKTSYSDVPYFSENKAPEGYISISMTQAMMEYGKPIFKISEVKNIEANNDVLQLIMIIWNYTISTENSKLNLILNKGKNSILKSMQKTLKMESSEASELFECMIAKKEELFPKDIQPQGGMIMYMKKEENYNIFAFPFHEINKSNKKYELTNKDLELKNGLNELDLKILNLEYDEWEKDFFDISDTCREAFEKWLEFYDVEESFESDIDIFLDFIYRYGHDENTSLKNVKDVIFEEFFFDFLLRKVICEPSEYTRWIPSVKLLYDFLYDIGYIENVKSIKRMINSIEPDFIQVLKDRY